MKMKRKLFVGLFALLCLQLSTAQNNHFPSSGDVGIGTTNPQAKLHVEGNVWGTGFKLNTNGLLKLRNFDGGDLGFRTALSAIYDTQTNRALLEINGRNNYKDGVIVKGDQLIIDGKVAIGVDMVNSNHQLTLRGTMLAEGVKIRAFDNWDWPDYVFEDDYNLIPLDELEVSIKEKGHLPNIPSAEEVQNDGFELEKMQAKLLEKIEELTLYTIQQQKEIEALKKQLQEVSNPNKQ